MWINRLEDTEMGEQGLSQHCTVSRWRALWSESLSGYEGERCTSGQWWWNKNNCALQDLHLIFVSSQNLQFLLTPLNAWSLKDSSRFNNVSLFLPCQLMEQLFANCFRRKDKNEGWYKMQSSISELLAGIFLDVFEFPSVCLYNVKHEMEMKAYQK